MPSLKELQEFKSSFANIGREDEVRIEQNLPEDDMPLPDFESEPSGGPETAEPEPFGGPETAEPAFDAGNAGEYQAGDDLLSFGDLGDLLETGSDLTGSGDLPENPEDSSFSNDMSALLDTIPDDLGIAEQAGSGESAPEDDFNAPSELLNGLSDSLENDDEPSSGEIPASDDENEDFADLDFGGLGEAQLPETGPLDDFSGEPFDFEAEDTGPEETGLPDELPPDTTEDISGELPDDFAAGLPDELPDTSEDISGELPDDFAAGLPDELPSDTSEDISGELPDDFAAGLPDDASDDLPIDLTDLPDFSDSMEPAGSMDLTAPEETSAQPDSTDLFDSVDILDLGGELNETPPAAGADDSMDLTDSLDSLELADFQEAGAPAVSEDSEDTADSYAGFDLEDDSAPINDFALPGIDDVFGTCSPADDSSVVDEILADSDEIKLSENEVHRLRETLASYPLNLRIACEELITEEIVAPDQMTSLIRNLTGGAPAKTTAALVGKILGRTITVSKGFEKMTGEQLETEQSSFAYIFIHNFLPVLRTFIAAALVLVSLGYLTWNFIYLPLKAESIYRRGYERIGAGEFGRSRDLFLEAFSIHQKKEWFYKYAEAYRDERQYIYAEEKYDELLNYTIYKSKRRIPEKRAVLEYAYMETYYLRNYSKADRLLRRGILDFSMKDRDALLALGDNALAWGDTEKERYEDAREAYALLMELYGRTDQILERMLKYFIRTDNLSEVIPLQRQFMSSERRKISAETLAELGGYLLDKSTAKTSGIPDESLQNIGGIREVLLRAVRSDPVLPESYYHLSRYYNFYGNYRDEELTLQRAIQSFDNAKTETPKRLGYRLEALRRFAEIHTQRGEFFRAEEFLVRGTSLYEDGLSRRIITPSPEYGRLYADLGDLEFFTKDGNASAALSLYRRSEQNGYAPPEIQYRMGAAHYQLRQWAQALDRFTSASFPLPYNQKILYALGNTSYLRGNYFAAQAYFDRLLEILEAGKMRFTLITPSEDRLQNELAERLMVVQNNLAVTLDALTLRTGDNSYRARALGLYSESQRAWDILTRNPETMIRMRPSPDINAPGVNPAYLNVQNSLYPIPGYEPLFFMRIDKDLPDPSYWERIAPSGYSLAEGVSTAFSR